MSINSITGNTLLQSGSFPPVRAASTGSPLNPATGGLLVVDGIQLVAGDRVLCKDETNAVNNGIYAASTGPWNRTTDATTNVQFFSGMLVTAALGTVNSGTVFMCTTTDNPVVVGTSLITWRASAVITLPISNSGLANMAASTIKGNATGGSAAPQDLTGAQAEQLLSFTQSGAGAVARLLDVKVKEVSVSVKDFNAKGDGTTDDTGAFQNAAATGLTFYAPPGSYKLTGTTSLTGNGQRIIGAGPLATVLLPSGTSDCIAFSGGNKGGGVEALQISAAGMSAGNAISCNNYSRLNLKNLILTSPFNGIFIEQCNGALVTDVYMDTLRGSYGVQWFGTNSARSDVLSLINVIMSGSAATGIIMDGNVATLNIHHVACTSMAAGLKTQNTSGGTAPAFIVSHNFEVDFPTNQGINLGASFSGGYFANTYVFGSAATENINIDSSVFDVSFTGGRCGDAFKQGIIAGGRYIRIGQMIIFANGQTSSGTLPGIEIGASSVGVTVVGNKIGQFTGLAVETQNYGVLIDNGAIEYRVVGNDMVGNVTGAVSDNSNDYSFSPPRSAVAFNGGSNLHRLGSQAVIGSNPSVDTMAFWGGTPTTQQTVTGSRGGNAALASLISKLAGYGLIVDGSSA